MWLLKSIQFEYYRVVTQPEFRTCEHLKKKENKNKNRYEQIRCWDETRVKTTPKNNDTDYIHANYVDSFGTPMKYVATQGPMKETIGQFWQMVWEQNSRIIVMLSELRVAGREKCASYWCTYNCKQQTFEAGELLIETVNERRKSGYIKTILDVRSCTTGERRRIKHYLYSDWPGICPWPRKTLARVGTFL